MDLATEMLKRRLMPSERPQDKLSTDEELGERAKLLYTRHKELCKSLRELDVEMAHAVGGVMWANDALGCDAQYSREHTQYRFVEDKIKTAKEQYADNIQRGRWLSREFGARLIKMAQNEMK